MRVSIKDIRVSINRLDYVHMVADFITRVFFIGQGELCLHIMQFIDNLLKIVFLGLTVPRIFTIDSNPANQLIIIYQYRLRLCSENVGNNYKKKSVAPVKKTKAYNPNTKQRNKGKKSCRQTCTVTNSS